MTRSGDPHRGIADAENRDTGSVTSARLVTKFTGGLMSGVLAVVMTLTLNVGSAAAEVTIESAPVSASTRAPSLVPTTQGASAVFMGAPSSTPAQCSTANASLDTVGKTAASEMTQLGHVASAKIATKALELARDAGFAPRTPTKFVQYEGVKAYGIEVEETKATSVTFPIVGANFVQLSNITFILNEKGDLVQYSESTVVERGVGVLEVTTYIDGVLANSTELNSNAGAIDLIAERSTGIAAVNTQTCLMAVLGVGAVVAGVILVLCGSSCAVPLTPPTAIVCAACIGGFAAVGGSTIAAVMGCFN